jgi:hypothetical protein
MKMIERGSIDEWIAHRNNWRAEPTMPSVETEDNNAERIEILTRNAHQFRTVPPGVVRIVITLDQQGNNVESAWFPYVIRGWSADGESWLIDAGKVLGFGGAEDLESIIWDCSGTKKMADLVAMDGANGNMTMYVQRWASEKASQRIVIHGLPNQVAPVVQRSNSDPRYKKRAKIINGVKYFMTSPDTWKTQVSDHIKSGKRWHLCSGAPDFYLASLGSETLVNVKGKGGRQKLTWRPKVYVTKSGVEEERKDNHWFDCETMQLVCAHLMKLEPKQTTTDEQSGKVGKTI